MKVGDISVDLYWLSRRCKLPTPFEGLIGVFYTELSPGLAPL